MITIPIKEYEKDMDTESVREKKKEILDLFMNSNQLSSQIEFYKIRSRLHEAILKCDLELIKIYLSETIENETKELTFKINKINKTASLFHVNKQIDHLIIPRSVKYESEDYLITSISGIKTHFLENSDVNIIEFDENSSVTTIYENSFDNSCVKCLNLPSSLIELKEGWCCGMHHLEKIIISPLNGQFMLKDDKILLGKNVNESDEFDVLLFAFNDIEEINIPSNITKISKYALSSCKKLTKIEFPEDSKLQIIESDTFCSLFIEEIYLSANLIELKDGWCRDVTNLKKIIISPLNGQFMLKGDKILLGKSVIKSDEFDLFLLAFGDIEEINIPSNITKISKYAFSSCKKLTKVEIPKDSKLEIIESYAFSNTKIERIFIPSNVSKIGEFAFFLCENLIEVDILENSKLKIIEEDVFDRTSIKEFTIPLNVTKISEYAFAFCKKLEKINIPENSKLQIIDSNAFYSTFLKEIYLPSSLIKLKKNWCCKMPCLKKVTISPLNNNFKLKDDKILLGKKVNESDEFDVLLFVNPDVQKIEIPSNIKIISSSAFAFSNIKEISISPNLEVIGEYAFFKCRKLVKFTIPLNSKLKSIKDIAFYKSKIKKIFIPSNVSKIGQYSFSKCFDLAKVDIPDDSKLEIIEERAFFAVNIDEIVIPKYVSIIGEQAFYYCSNLCKVKFSSDSNLKEIHDEAFFHSKIKDISIPSSVYLIGENAFSECVNLQIIEINESLLKSLLKSDLLNNQGLIIMVNH